MKNICKILGLSLIYSMFFTLICYADNPIVQTNYTADPAPMVYNDTCYLYTSHDEDKIVNNFFTMNDWKCYSSKDMVNWTDHGTPLAYTDFTWAKGDAWAGQCVPRNGKFYYYVPMTAKSGGTSIGVAVSDSPTGPFKDAIGKPLIAPGYGNIDPTVFVDDDGQAYLYWGNPDLKYVKLNENMVSYSGSVVTVPLTVASFGARSKTDRATSYEEGPWFYKRGSLYYMVFAGGPISEHIAYSTSTSPTGPWTYRGKIMPTQGGSFTNHAGVVDFKGNSYFFYHNGALPDGGGFHRSVCVEKFSYNADGTFPTINMTTTGTPAASNLNPYIKTEAETICWESGVETEKCSEGGMDVCNIENGDYIKVKGVNFGTSGATAFDARVASANSGGNIELRLDSPTGKLVGTCAVKGTGGWQTWVDATCTVSGATGIHDLYLKFTGGSGFLFNINWWKFTTVTSPVSAFSKIEAESYSNQLGIQNVTCDEGTEGIGYTENGDYAVYSNVDFETGAKSFKARVSSAVNPGKIELRLDSANGTLVGTCMVSSTGDWQTFDDVVCNVSEVSGKHDLYLNFIGEGGYLINLNWFEFSKVSDHPTLSGDLNGDNSVDATDYALMKMYLLGTISEFPVENDALAADLNGDGEIDAIDFAVFKKFLLGDITELP